MKKIHILVSFLFIFIYSAAYSILPPTIQKRGRWVSLSSSFVVDAIIDDKQEKVCLPKLEFKENVDKELLERTLREGFQSQDAVFNLYHDGLGKPKKENGLYYSSDVFLKDLDMTFTGYLRNCGFKFKVSTTPTLEDTDYLQEVLMKEQSSSFVKKLNKVEEKKEEKRAKEGRPGSKSTLRVASVYDVLPKGVLPHPIRNEQAKVAAIVANLKARPYKTEIIQIDPLRWASGKMGSLNEKGEIDMAKC